MNRFGFSLLTLLVATTMAVGQPSPTLPMPSALPTPPPTGPDEIIVPARAPFSLFEAFHPVSRCFVTGEAEYLLWFVKGDRPTISIASSGTDTSHLADTDSSIGPLSGGRLTLGFWQYDNNPWLRDGVVRTLGLETRFFFVGIPGVDVNTDGPPTLTRPFFDLNNRADSSFLVASPGVATGSISGHAQLGIWGAEANVWKNVYCETPGTICIVDLMAGLRYLNANSEVEINSTSEFNNNIAAGSPFASFAGNRLQVNDSFSVHNNFVGGQVGISVKSWLEEFATVEGSFRLAVGTTRQDLTINGSQVRTFANGTTANYEGGLLALPSNIGTRHNYVFSQIPEGNLKFLVPMGKQITLSAGFTAMYWNHVARAVNQIDRGLDITQIPNFPGSAAASSSGLGRPAALFQQSDLWLLGISFGIEYHW
jgi:Putative beta barrel porin-7 (BBP7)